MRDASPTVVLIPGMGMFSFGKNKTEARITGEFYTNAIHVMEGASLLGEGEVAGHCAAVPAGDGSGQLQGVLELRGAAGHGGVSHRVLGAGRSEDSPPAAGEGTEPARGAGGWRSQRHRARSGAAGCGARRACFYCRPQRGGRGAGGGGAGLGGVAGVCVEQSAVDIRSRESIREVLGAAALAFGGIDILINTAAIFPSTLEGDIPDDMWADTLAVNVTANYLLADEAAKLFEEQGLHGNIVFTSSANAVVAKRGSEAYDVSKAALSHLIRELAVSMAPNVRVNGISPATVVKGSTMFGRDRLRASLTKYNIPFQESFSDEELRSRLAAFYAERTLTNKAIDPADCAEAILFLASPRARCTTGHVIPVDGGLTEAFQR